MVTHIVLSVKESLLLDVFIKGNLVRGVNERSLDIRLVKC